VSFDFTGRGVICAVDFFLVDDIVAVVDVAVVDVAFDVDDFGSGTGVCSTTLVP
jgi:hypothetical protein